MILWFVCRTLCQLNGGYLLWIDEPTMRYEPFKVVTS